MALVHPLLVSASVLDPLIDLVVEGSVQVLQFFYAAALIGPLDLHSYVTSLLSPLFLSLC